MSTPQPPRPATVKDNPQGERGSAPGLEHALIRQRIFVYNLIVVAVLVGLVWWYFTGRPWSLSRAIPDVLRGAPIYAVWFGALGGVVISLKGVYDHGPAEWKTQWDLWHIGRPFSGGIAGGVTYLLLLVVSKSQPSVPVALAAAFVVGTQERTFFNFLKEVGRLVLQVPGDQSGASMAMDRVSPTGGAAGATLSIVGRGFSSGAIVLLGDRPLENVVVNAEGTVITGRVPKSVGSGLGLLVVNPGGANASLPGVFSYLPLSPASLDFGNCTLGATSVPLPVVFTNTDSVARKVQVSVTGDPNFVIARNTCQDVALNSGEICTVEVQFQPVGAAGSRTANLQVVTDGGATLTAPLSGVALATAPP
ncbi:MAG TPA: IPT/TIG domain-containing protein [Thermomicrobiaceae bacterium]|nr:IPT/TIG domain-containing protein [Thermomicrobiaceae bacterium]